MRRRFLEMDGDHLGAILLVYRAFEHMRRVVGSGVDLERAYPRTSRRTCIRGRGGRLVSCRGPSTHRRDDGADPRGMQQIASAGSRVH